MNPMQLIQMISNNGNPEQFVMNMLKERAQQNPMYESILQMALKGDSKGIENFARNVMKERGFDFDKEFNLFTKSLRR